MFDQYSRRERQNPSDDENFDEDDEPPPDIRHYKIIFQGSRPYIVDSKHSTFLSERAVLADIKDSLREDSGLSGKLDVRALGITFHSLIGKDSRDDE